MSEQSERMITDPCSPRSGERLTGAPAAGPTQTPGVNEGEHQ
jgi:hypothetical protein